MVQVSGGDLQRLRQLNSLGSIQVLRTAPGPLTLSELGAGTGLSRASIGDVIGALVDLGWVVEAPPEPGGIGRPARRYRFHAETGHVLGVDIGVHKVLATVTDLGGRAVASGRVAAEPDLPRAERLDALDRAVQACLLAAGMTPADIWSVTAGTVGVVDREGVIARVAAIPDWAGTDLVGHLGRTFSCPITVENDSKLAALAEHRIGVARETRDLVFIQAGRRPGAALIIGGALHHGFNGFTGEVGLLENTGWPTMIETLEGCPVARGAAGAEAAGLVFAAARNGVAAATQAVERYAADLAVGTAAMVLTLDPELVVLGGGFSRSGDVLLDPFRRALEPLCLRMPEIRLSTLGEECVVLGAACLALSDLDQQFFPPQGEIVPPAAPRRVV